MIELCQAEIDDLKSALNYSMSFPVGGIRFDCAHCFASSSFGVKPAEHALGCTGKRLLKMLEDKQAARQKLF